MSSQIIELAAQISANTSNIHEYLASNALPFPSFDEDGPVDLKLSPKIAGARMAAINAATELQALLLGPADQLRPIINATSLEAISKYDMARKVPLGGEITFVELAEACGLYEPDLRRIVRFAISHHHVFREPRKGVLTHSAASRRLAVEQEARDGLGLMFDDSWHSFARTVEAMEKSEERDPTMTGWALAHNGMSLYQTMEAEPERARRFAGAMGSFNRSPGMSYKFMVSEIPWASMPNGKVVDLGGSHGELCIAIAESCPSLEFVVQDLPRTVQSVDKSQISTDILNRIEFMEHDFFDPQPVKANVYIFRQIFHNWSDSLVIKILRQLIPALEHGSRIIVNDQLLPQPGEVPLMVEKFIRATDMLMMSLFNSRERDRDDWVQVFREADERFVFEKAHVPQGSVMGIIEVVRNGHTGADAHVD